VVRSSFSLQLCNWASGRQQEHFWLPIETARQRGRLNRLVATPLATITVEPHNHRVLGIIMAQVSDPLAVEVLAKHVNSPIADDADAARDNHKLKVVAAARTYGRNRYIPVIDHLHGNVISPFHDKPKSRYFNAHKTTELQSRDFNWPPMACMDISMSAAVKCSTKSRILAMPGTGSTCR